jgi:hypothetical protein
MLVFIRQKWQAAPALWLMVVLFGIDFHQNGRWITGILFLMAIK